MSFKVALYNDFHLHGASAPEWKQRYVQLSPGAMRSSLVEATSGQVHVFRKRMSEQVVQQGCVPAGRICFAVLSRNTLGTPRVQGHELRENSLFILRGGEEFTIQRPRAMELLAVTFEAEELLGLLEDRPWPAQARSLLSRSAFLASPRSLQRLRRDLLGLLDGTLSSSPGGTGSIRDQAGSQIVFEALGNLFCVASGMVQKLANASSNFIVNECHRVVAESGDEPPAIDVLCWRLRTSRRTLQNSFRQVADTTPVHYLRSVRLNAVRRRLMATRHGDLCVSQAAADQGFFHLSHFANRYKTLFGELPSQTLRGSASPARGGLERA